MSITSSHIVMNVAASGVKMILIIHYVYNDICLGIDTNLTLSKYLIYLNLLIDYSVLEVY